MFYEEEIFENLQYEAKTFEDYRFSDCVFRNCGVYETEFRHCTFRHCTFENCTVLNNRFQFTNAADNRFHDCSLVGIAWNEITEENQILFC